MPLLLGYYGDDLTGSTDVMEALELRGVPTVLFTALPSAELAGRPTRRPGPMGKPLKATGVVLD